MRLGCCGSMIAPERDPIGIESVELAARLGFDYVELSLSHMSALPEASFRSLVARVAASGIRCESCNNFFPPPVRLTGPDAQLDAVLEYAERALGRAAALGVSAIVLGSSGAKNLPEGFSRERARRQFLCVLRALGPLAAAHDLTIVLEPISHPEANFVNLAAEALEYVREANHPHIQLLVDYYHLVNEREDPRVLLKAGPALRHAHFANPVGRSFPLAWEAEYAAFFGALRDAQYEGRMSIEAYTSDFAADGARALSVLRSALPKYAL